MQLYQIKQLENIKNRITVDIVSNPSSSEELINKKTIPATKKSTKNTQNNAKIKFSNSIGFELTAIKGGIDFLLTLHIINLKMNNQIYI